MKRPVLAWSLLLLTATLVLGALRADRPWQRLQAEFIDRTTDENGAAARPPSIPWRRLPGLRRLDPAIAVAEVTPPGLMRPTPQGPVPRVDRCATCHLGALDAAATLEVPPFAPHPHLELFVAANSPHPYEKFGCTVCHGGDGRATDFSRAGHRPESDAEAVAWAARWRYSPAPTKEPILPSDLVEASCAACHESAFYLEVLAQDGKNQGARTTDHLEKLEYGRRLERHLGCAGCHGARQHAAGDAPGIHAAGKRYRGPPLDRLAVKTSREWTFHWIAAPRLFRPTTAMPHLFHDAAVDPEATARIRAIVEFLFASFGGSGTLKPGQLEAPPAGDAELGAALFAGIGCRACHLLDEVSLRAEVPLERLRGPQLARSGDKLDLAWLFAFLRRPGAHWPATAMPDLRLSDKEAADLAAFLAAQSDPAWSDRSLPSVDPRARDAAILRHLEAEDAATATARLERMSEAEKERYLGRQSLLLYGCHGCHLLPENADAMAPAAPLGELARQRRGLSIIDGMAAVAHGPAAARPVGAPDYALSQSEASALLVAFLARRDNPVEPRRDPEQNARAATVAAGEELLEHYGCLGCHALGSHTLDDRAAAFPDAALAPPSLDAVGARLRSEWLAAYLHDPSSPRRPWLDVRMPTYAFAPGELDTLTRFFAALDGVDLFTAPPPPPAPAEVAVGRAVARLLRCLRCHEAASEAQDSPATIRAPSYAGARQRLRPRFVIDWILDPRSLVPETRMPTSFQEDGEPDTAFLVAMLEAPMFQDEQRRLLTSLASRQELEELLADPERVAAALRAYLFNLDE